MHKTQIKIGNLVCWKVQAGLDPQDFGFEYGIVTEIKLSKFFKKKESKQKKSVVTVLSDGIILKFFCHELEVVKNEN